MQTEGMRSCKTRVQEEDMRQMHQELLNCSLSLEKEIALEEEIRTKQLNEICVLSAQISETTDHVEKAKLRENELTERVARWVEYLREEKQKMMARDSRLYATGTLSANISDDIEYLISMLMQMRHRVEMNISETKQRKREHRHQLRHIRNEMLEMHKELLEWDKKFDETVELTRRMSITREHLQDRIKEQQQRETTAKLICMDLDKKLHDLVGSNSSTDVVFQEDSNIETIKYHFATTTTASFEAPPLGEALRTSKQIEL
ncbi:hypothetical protein Q1695_002372 [Nippostrongylus brasiliensis]|nr:hypothetical protein Q1695_002372 [Nippostrongylus brasiliensis]